MPSDQLISERDFFLYVQEHRREGESAYEAADRIITFYAMAISEWQQLKASRLVGISDRMMNYHAAAYRLRPKDLGRKGEAVEL